MSKSSRNISSNSELVKCANQIKAMGLSLFLIVVALIVFSTIPMSELMKLTSSQTSQDQTNQDQVPPTEDQLKLFPETVNKFYGILFLTVLAIVIFVASLFIATSKGCYKTSIFGLLFGLLFGIF